MASLAAAPSKNEYTGWKALARSTSNNTHTVRCERRGGNGDSGPDPPRLLLRDGWMDGDDSAHSTGVLQDFSQQDGTQQAGSRAEKTLQEGVSAVSTLESVVTLEIRAASPTYLLAKPNASGPRCRSGTSGIV